MHRFVSMLGFGKRPILRPLTGGVGGLLLLLLPSCVSSGDALRVGTATIGHARLESVRAGLAALRPTWGHETLRWIALDRGLGPSAVRHASQGARSQRRRLQAATAAARLARGEEPRQVASASGGIYEPDATLLEPWPPNLDSQVAAVVARLRPGAWSVPVATSRGWELLHLLEASGTGPYRTRVRVERILFELGPGNAGTAWTGQLLDGDPDLLEQLPTAFTRNRIR